MTVPVSSLGFSLADSLDPMMRYLPDQLANAAARSRLSDVAQQLPPVHRALLECRFDAPEVVDLSLGVRNCPEETSRLMAALLRISGDSPAWRRVRAFLTDWIAEDGTEDHIWLEFDLDGTGVPAPSVFVSTQSAGSPDALRHLSDNAIDTLEYWRARLPKEAALHFAGVMVPRGDPSLRLNLSGLSADAAWRWLSDHGGHLPPDARHGFDAVFAAGTVITMVEARFETLQPRVGLECRPHSDNDSVRLFDYCADNGLCPPQALDIAREWSGVSSPLIEPSGFPAALILDAIASGGAEPVSLLRHINHLKVSFDTNGATSAKLYLGYTHKNADLDGTGDGAQNE